MATLPAPDRDGRKGANPPSGKAQPLSTMTAPRLQINLAKIDHNARVLVERIKQRGIATTGVTKAFLGLPELAQILVDAGVCALGDARIENIEAMRRDRVVAKMILIRSADAQPS